MTIHVLTLHCICHGFGKINAYGICLTHHRQIPVIMYFVYWWDRKQWFLF